MSKVLYTLIKENTKTKEVKENQDYDEIRFKKMNKDGWGIFRTVNEFDGKRSRDNCTKLNYCYCDFDIAKDDEELTRDQKDIRKLIALKKLIKKCEPTIVIDTSNGFQPLWQITDNEPTEDNKCLYEKANKGITEFSKTIGSYGDSVHDVSRILRKPGYYHMKGEPYMCNVVHQSGKKYLLSELEQIFPYSEPLVKQVEYVAGDNPTFDAIKMIPFRDIIIAAFAETGRPVTFDESGHLIDPVGKTTGTFQGRNGDRRYLASSSHDPVKGNEITSVADILDITYSDAFKWICNKFNIDEIKSKQHTKRLEKIKPIVEEDKRYTWGTTELNHSLAIIKPGNFIVAAAKSNAGKTTFVFNMACKNAALGHKVLFVSLEMDTCDILDDIGRKYAGITISEEYNKTTPDHKSKAYTRKKKELESIENLSLNGIRRDGNVKWDDIEDLVKEQSNVDILFVDNLDLISTGGEDSDNERQKKIVKSILNFTSFTKIPVVLIHHYRKTGANSKDMGMDEMAGSGKIRDGADRVIKITRNAEPDAPYPDKYRSTIYLQKGRGYPETMKDVYFIRGDFVDIPPSEENYYNSGALSSDEITNLLND